MSTSRLKQKYQEEIAPVLNKEFGIKNPMATPKIVKVVINAGIGEIGRNKDQMEATARDLATITGQKPSIRPAKVSVASFSLRQGMPVGLKVTLRGERMYEFLDRLFSLVLPRLRDFRGIPRKSMDTHGNYTLGIEEHVVFPEVDVTKVAKNFGLEVSIVTNSKSKEQSLRLMELMGMPFEKE